jgi:hypothetical protein
MRDSGSERFEIRFTPRLRWLLSAFGMGPRRCTVLLSGDSLRVRACLFGVEVPRSAITRACASLSGASTSVSPTASG